MTDLAQKSLAATTPNGPQDAVPAGLTTVEANGRLREFGFNTVADEVAPEWRRYLAKFWSPIAWLLEVAIVLQIGAGKYVEAAIVGGLLAFNATLGFIQEGRAGAVLAALKKKLAPTALVRRDGNWVRLPAADVVPGDIIRLPLGAVIPADARVLSGSAMVDQSMLTGESVPIDAEPGGQVYAGALVRRGQAVAEVTATGSRTYFGRGAELVRMAHSASTEQAAVFAVTRNLMIVNGAVAILIIVYGLALALPFSELIALALTALLATIPVALPATFTLSAALSAQILAQRGVLLARLSAAHEAAAMDILCADKTGTLTRNALEVVEVTALPEFDRARVLHLAALASSEAGDDPIDSAICAAATKETVGSERRLRFVPFDPASKTSEAIAIDGTGNQIRVVKGAFEVISRLAKIPANARQLVDDLAAKGHRVLAVAAGSAETSLRLAGLIAISDPPRDDSSTLISALRDMGVRTVMVTGDSAVTAASIAHMVGISGDVCPPESVSSDLSTDRFGVFARIVPEEKYRLVQTLQSHGHVVGMCGDGVNDAPALRQAQIGIAVSSATDAAKAAAGMILTEPGLAGVVLAVREGRIGFQRLVTYAFNMLVKKIEIVLFLAIGLGITGQAILNPPLIVLMLVTNDLLAMSLTTDRASPTQFPSVWRMRNITLAAIVLGVCKLCFSTGILVVGKFQLGLRAGELQTLAFVTLVFGSQGLLYVVRERRRLWSSKPGNWALAASTVDIVIASTLAWSGTLMMPLAWPVMVVVFAAVVGFALVLDQFKLWIVKACTV